MFWSGGKDSAMALDRVRRGGEYDIVSLITTINPEFGRVSMHGVPVGLVEAQAEAAGLPLQRMPVASASNNDTYLAALRTVLRNERERGVEAIIFGDIFLADLRAWREELLAEAGLNGLFPLWGEDTSALAQEFVARGFKAILCCADDARLDERALGRELDEDFFASLPAGVDPCGENGEYHSFVYAGPVFQRPVRYRPGERVYRPLVPAGATVAPAADDTDTSIGVPSALAGSPTKGFWFLDLQPEG